MKTRAQFCCVFFLDDLEFAIFMLRLEVYITTDAIAPSPTAAGNHMNKQI